MIGDDDPLFVQTAEVRARLVGRSLTRSDPGQLLGCRDDRCLVRTADGLAVQPADLLPRSSLDLAPLIDHTLLRADATEAELATLCDEARAYRFASVCVNSLWVPLAAALLGGSGVRVCATAGFPLGAMGVRAKAFEAEQALAEGASEVDMVLAIGALRSGDWATVERDLCAVRASVPRGEAVLKVIVETCLLDRAQIARACALAAAAGVDFVKTSTGFSTAGATEADVALMRGTVGPSVGVKASGGIRSYGDALRMVRAGATRLGLSASVTVVDGGTKRTLGSG